MKTINLKSRREASILRKHPWIFSGGIKRTDPDIEDGDLVRVLDSGGKFMAIGFYQNSSLSVRILSFMEIEIDLHFFQMRFEAALTTRKDLSLLSTENNIFRLFNAYGDGVPGLIIDYYAGLLVVQFHHKGLLTFKEVIVEAIQQLQLDVKGIYLKPPNANLVHEAKWVREQLSNVIAKEEEIQYYIEPVDGQKTGFFIDQRENRGLLKKLAKGKSVLNTFCYSGGFSLAAYAGGAIEVTSIDSSSKAMDLCKKNIQLNGYNASPDRMVTQDVFQFFENDQKQYDIVVLDPPAFTKNKHKLPQATKAYQRLNVEGIKKVKNKGLLMTFSCSQWVSNQLFEDTIRAAAIIGGRKISVLKKLTAAACHPYSIYQPEGEYLKGLLLRVEN